MTLPDPEVTPTLTVMEAAGLLDVGRTVAYQSIRDGSWPTSVIRVGANIIRIPTVELLQVLGHDEDEDVPGDGWSVTMGGNLVRTEEPNDA